MTELIIHESFPLKDEGKYVDVAVSIAKQLDGQVIGLPVMLEFEFYCVNECECPHRVAADGHRWVVNALVVAGVLPGCGWKCVGGFIDTFHIDEKDPRVVVRIV